MLEKLATMDAEVLKCIESLIGRCRFVQCDLLFSTITAFTPYVKCVCSMYSVYTLCTVCTCSILYVECVCSMYSMSKYVLIYPCSVLRWEGHERSGYSSLESHCTGNLPDYKFIWSLFRFLQLLCEGHSEGRTLSIAIYLLYVLHVHQILSCVSLVVGEYTGTCNAFLLHRLSYWCSHCVTGT